MNRQKLLFTALVLSVVSGRAWSTMGTATIQGTREESEITGSLKFEDSAKGLKIFGTIDNIPSGEHGFHIHEFGDCSEEGKSAGSHFNPDKKPHGHALKDGPHKVHPGDMGNLISDEKGTANIDLFLPGVSLTGGKYAVAGRAVIVHETKDDFGQPLGNAGGRIACGTIILTGK